MKVGFKNLLSRAISFDQQEIKWHHHYLPPNCSLNTSSKYLIILEAEGNQWKSIFEKKPTKQLEKLENLFFGRI